MRTYVFIDHCIKCHTCMHGVEFVLHIRYTTYSLLGVVMMTQIGGDPWLTG